MEKSTSAFLDELEKTAKEVAEMAAAGAISYEAAHATLEHLNNLRNDIIYDNQT